MTTTAPARVVVVLTGLAGLVEAFLEQELRGHPWLTIARLPDDGRLGRAIGADDSLVIVAGAPPLPRCATDLLIPGRRVLGTLAVTNTPPVGDVYRIPPAGQNVSPQELAQLIRQLAIGHRDTPTAASR